jgi:hypothetical protein
VPDYNPARNSQGQQVKANTQSSCLLPFCKSFAEVRTSLQVCQAEGDVGQVWLVSYRIAKATRAHARVPEAAAAAPAAVSVMAAAAPVCP